MDAMPSAFLFDLDGVVIDTAKYHFLAWHALAEELGFEFSEFDNERLKGVSRMQSLVILLEIGGLQLNDKSKMELAERKNRKYRQLVLQMKKNEILPGALNFLSETKKVGVKTALASASKNASDIIEHLGIGYCFDAIVDGNAVLHSKPDPEVFIRAAMQLNAPSDKCIVFEDAAAGIQAGLAAGMYCIGVGAKKNLTQANFVIGGLEKIHPQDAIRRYSDFLLHRKV